MIIMKKLILLLGLVIACNKANTNEENPIICCDHPPFFSLMINKTSELYKEFMNSEGEFDVKNVSLYRLDNNVKKEYHLESLVKQEYLSVGTRLSRTNDIYTGKVETLYLQNAKKTYKIEVEGEMIDEDECCDYAKLKEIRVDGVKIEECYLAK